MIFEFEDPESGEQIIGRYDAGFNWRNGEGPEGLSLSIPADPIAIFADISVDGLRHSWVVRSVSEDSNGNPLALLSRSGSASTNDGAMRAVEDLLRSCAR